MSLRSAPVTHFLQETAKDHTTAAAVQSLQQENLALRTTLQEMSQLALPPELAGEQTFQVCPLE